MLPLEYWMQHDDKDIVAACKRIREIPDPLAVDARLHSQCFEHNFSTENKTRQIRLTLKEKRNGNQKESTEQKNWCAEQNGNSTECHKNTIEIDKSQRSRSRLVDEKQTFEKARNALTQTANGMSEKTEEVATAHKPIKTHDEMRRQKYQQKLHMENGTTKGNTVAQRWTKRDGW
jgi:hypothetical protein